MKAKRNLVKTCLLFAVLLHALTSEAQTVIQIAGKDWQHRLILKSDGSLWDMDCRNMTTGVDEFPRSMPVEPPVQIVASGVTAIATGENHSLFLKNDGSLWLRGYHGRAHFADGNDYTTQIVASGVTAIAAGYAHSLFLKSDSSLWAMGDNGNGELGNGTYNNANLPEQIVASGVTAIAAGDSHSLFVKSDGSLWGMGWNFRGELGDGNYNNRINRPEQIVVSNVTAVAAGENHSLFLKSDGSLWGMGLDNWGQLGDHTTHNGKYSANRPEQIVASNVTAIAAGTDSSVFLKGDGSLWATGWDHDGQLGKGISFFTDQPVQILAANKSLVVAGFYYSPFLKSTGSLWANSFNNNKYGNPSDGTKSTVNKPGQIVASPPGYNLISIELLSDGNVRLSYVGTAGASYALDRSFNLAPPNWVPQATNSAGTGGVLIFTNMPDQANNNFWRIRSVP